MCFMQTHFVEIGRGAAVDRLMIGDGRRRRTAMEYASVSVKSPHGGTDGS